ncbi:MAG: peptidase T [Dysgonamonadaceae bacterium]|jgi:tripeptide aminopeptidase|nr:peptidase T [Dysgonamonadaceae bacterium]
MTVTDRFLKYITFDTQSDDTTSDAIPSTHKQLLFARELEKELQEMHLEDISLNEHAYLMAMLPANTDKKVPVIGFIAHIDTSPDMSGENVQARIVNKYQGEDILLDQQENILLSPSEFPELLHYVGQDIIVTDGKTLLGADDKAGIAEIVAAIRYLQEHPEIKHGKIKIAFTPDEEIGRGASAFDVQQFGCDWAYTMDGGEIGELEYENFNAAAASITFKGKNVHPGTAKNKMVNAMHLAMQYASMLPARERPEHTEGYEGFFHLTKMDGTVENAVLSYIVRDHDRLLFEKRLETLQKITDALNVQYPNAVQLEIRQQYKNMKEIISSSMHIVALASRAMEAAGVQPVIKPIRGGTDGCQLSFKGLPCPNIFAGGVNFHGKYEFVPIQSMEKAVQVIVKIVALACTDL